MHCRAKTHKYAWRTLHVRRRSRNSPKELFLRGAGSKYACTAGRKHTKELFLRGAGTKYACTAGRKHTNLQEFTKAHYGQTQKPVITRSLAPL